MSGREHKPHLAFVVNDPRKELFGIVVQSCPISIRSQAPKLIPIRSTGVPKRTTKSKSKIHRQREHWQLAHALPLECNDWSLIETKYAEWEKGTPKSCGCGKGWEALTKEHPPVFDTRLGLALWFWQRHNDVNQRLRAEKGGHPHVTWSDCCAMHGYPVDWQSR